MRTGKQMEGIRQHIAGTCNRTVKTAKEQTSDGVGWVTNEYLTEWTKRQTDN